MPQGKGTYGSQVGRPKKNLHTDPPRGGRSIPKVTPKKGVASPVKRAGGRVASPVKRATGGGQPVRRAKAPVGGRRSAPTRGGRR
jgi:hypothetical protein